MTRLQYSVPIYSKGANIEQKLREFFGQTWLLQKSDMDKLYSNFDLDKWKDIQLKLQNAMCIFFVWDAKFAGNRLIFICIMYSIFLLPKKKIYVL